MEIRSMHDEQRKAIVFEVRDFKIQRCFTTAPPTTTAPMWSAIRG
jgi:hypothetical protein